MSGICDGRVVIITGAGRGIGRAHALEFARHGAKVVVNDVGGESKSPAEEVVQEIISLGGEAVSNTGDVSDWADAKKLIDTAVIEFGRLDVLVNNAGIIRDRSLVKMTEEEWDSVVRVHLKGTFAPSHFAALYWKELTATGNPADARLINTTSASGLYGNPGQTNYGSAKAGIASFTLTAALELKKFGVTVNAISPGALTRMTAPLGMDKLAAKGAAKGFDFTDPANIAPLVVWLGSGQSSEVTGRVFEIFGGKLKLCAGWTEAAVVNKKARWDVAELGDAIQSLINES